MGVSSFRCRVSSAAIRDTGHGTRDTLKAQASMELMVTLGVVLAFTVPVVFLLLTISQVGYENAAAAQADAAARSLADTMNLVYGEGAGAKRIVLMNTPSGTQNITAGRGEVTVTVKLSTGMYEASAPTFANVSGNQQVILNRKGLFPLEVRVDDATGTVKLSDVNK